MDASRQNAPIDILLIDDDAADLRLMHEVLKEGSPHIRLSVARDGQEAMRFLRGESAPSDAPRPALIVLDLNLPRKDGREVLAEIKGHPDLKRIPVLVLTTSSSEQDILRCYNLHANCYIIKPLGLEEFAAMVEAIQTFWLRLVTLPPRS